MLQRARLILVFLCLAGAFAAVFAACDVRTSGVKLRFQAQAIGSLSSGKVVAPFVNRREWKIEFKQAHMLVGPFYLYEGEPQVRLWDLLRPWRVAYAHVNANRQRVLGELREHFVLDLRKTTPTSLGEMRGIAGVAQTAELYLLPPGGTRLAKGSAALSHVSGATVHVVGSATKGTETRTFQLTATFPKSKQMHFVSNIGVEVPLQEDTVKQGHLLLRVYVDRWFTNVDFGSLTQQDKEGRFVVTADNNAISQGVRSRHSYNLSWRSK